MSNNSHVINVKFIFFISEILFHSRMPTYYLLSVEIQPDCQGPPAAGGLYQVAGGRWCMATNICMIQSLLPYPDLCRVQGPVGHQAQRLHPWLGAQGHVGEHRVHHEQAGGQLGQDLPGQES